MPLTLHSASSIHGSWLLNKYSYSHSTDLATAPTDVDWTHFPHRDNLYLIAGTNSGGAVTLKVIWGVEILENLLLNPRELLVLGRPPCLAFKSANPVRRVQVRFRTHGEYEDAKALLVRCGCEVRQKQGMSQGRTEAGMSASQQQLHSQSQSQFGLHSHGPSSLLLRDDRPHSTDGMPQVPMGCAMGYHGGGGTGFNQYFGVAPQQQQSPHHHHFLTPDQQQQQQRHLTMLDQQQQHPNLQQQHFPSQQYPYAPLRYEGPLTPPTTSSGFPHSAIQSTVATTTTTASASTSIPTHPTPSASLSPPLLTDPILDDDDLPPPRQPIILEPHKKRGADEIAGSLPPLKRPTPMPKPELLLTPVQKPARRAAARKMPAAEKKQPSIARGRKRKYKKQEEEEGEEEGEEGGEGDGMLLKPEATTTSTTAAAAKKATAAAKRAAAAAAKRAATAAKRAATAAASAAKKTTPTTAATRPKPSNSTPLSPISEETTSDDEEDEKKLENPMTTSSTASKKTAATSTKKPTASAKRSGDTTAAAAGEEKKAAHIPIDYEELIIEALNDEAFVEMCEQIGSVWQRIGFGGVGRGMFPRRSGE